MTVWLRRMGRDPTIIERHLEDQGLPKDLTISPWWKVASYRCRHIAQERGGCGNLFPARRGVWAEVSHWVDARRDSCGRV